MKIIGHMVQLFGQLLQIEQYLEKSFFEQYNKAMSHKVIKKLEKSQLIKNKYLVVENPFNDNQSETPNPEKEKKSKSVIDLLNTRIAKKRSKKQNRSWNFEEIY